MPLSMSRLILYVRDVARLKSFYQTHFDLAVVEEIENEWVVFNAGGVELALCTWSANLIAISRDDPMRSRTRRSSSWCPPDCRNFVSGSLRPACRCATSSASQDSRC